MSVKSKINKEKIIPMKKSIPPAFDHGRHKETEDAGTSESLQFVFEQQLEKIPWEGEFTIRSDL